MNEEENVNTGSAPEASEGADKKNKKGLMKRLNRRAYLEDIHRTADGRYIYTGQCYVYNEEANTRGSVLLRLWLLVLPAIAASVLGGCFNTPFLRDTWYVIAPFAFELVCTGSILWAVGRITANGRILREYVRKQTFGAIPLRAGFAIGFAALGLIGAIIYMILHGTVIENYAGEIIDMTYASYVYIALKVFNIACCILIMRYAPSVSWNETAEKV
ncbi:MAG: hypothetical protein J5756_00520 [Clostridia bacterium]|nr:hypothetical protein [Clostridia bacterium]